MPKAGGLSTEARPIHLLLLKLIEADQIHGPPVGHGHMGAQAKYRGRCDLE